MESMSRFPVAEFKTFPKELAILRALHTPAAVQDFLNKLPFNFEEHGETYRSPIMVLKAKKAHCMEGAMLAAAALWLQGRPPLLMDLKTADGRDVDHVVALFKERGGWGAISKTNHAVLRWRDPVFRDPRELAMSYFNEYFLDDGVKTMRSYSAPFDLSRHAVATDGDAWLTAPEQLYDITAALDRSRHFPIIKKGAERTLRRAEPIEIKAGKIVEWGKKR